MGPRSIANKQRQACRQRQCDAAALVKDGPKKGNGARAPGSVSVRLDRYPASFEASLREAPQDDVFLHAIIDARHREGVRRTHLERRTAVMHRQTETPHAPRALQPAERVC
jgi:hypothetical protein